jgi:uncharacterized membrane protein YeiB
MYVPVSPPPYSSAHKVIGLIIIVIMCCQAAIGLWAHLAYKKEREKTPLWPDHAHVWLGRLLFLLTAANVLAGVAEFEPSRPTAYILLGIWIGVVVVVFVGLYVLRRLLSSKDRPESTTNRVLVLATAVVCVIGVGLVVSACTQYT